MGDVGVLVRLRRTLRKRERLLVVLFLSSTLAIVAIVVIESLRTHALNFVERGLLWRERLWSDQVEHAQGLVEKGRFNEAVDLLERLDFLFPARHIKHARGWQRQQILAALGHAYAELGRKRRALETLRRGVEFDPRNFENHFRLGRAASRFHEPEEALSAYQRVLAINPVHLETVEAVVALFAAQGKFAKVVETYESYLAAFWIENLELELGNRATVVRVPVDGVFHDVEAHFVVPAETVSDLRLLADRLAWDVERIVLRSALRVGEPGRASIQLTLPSKTPTEFRVPVPNGISPIAVVHLRVRLFKPVSAGLWNEVQRAYRNELAWGALAAARAKTRVGGTEPTL